MLPKCFELFPSPGQLTAELPEILRPEPAGAVLRAGVGIGPRGISPGCLPASLTLLLTLALLVLRGSAKTIFQGLERRDHLAGFLEGLPEALFAGFTDGAFRRLQAFLQSAENTLDVLFEIPGVFLRSLLHHAAGVQDLLTDLVVANLVGRLGQAPARLGLVAQRFAGQLVQVDFQAPDVAAHPLLGLLDGAEVGLGIGVGRVETLNSADHLLLLAS